MIENFMCFLTRLN